jgi:hypothetical protein
MADQVVVTGALRNVGSVVVASIGQYLCGWLRPEA